MNHPVASERFARHALGTRYEDLSDDAVLQAKTFILDTMGVGIAGSSAAGADELSQVSAGWGQGAEACVWGRRKRVPAPTAAFLNGFQVHCQEYDCLHEKAVLHAMATLLPATIAYAERMGGVSGRELIAAVVVGIDVAVNLGIAAREGLKFFRPATSGGFGATAAIARLGRFDLDTLYALQCVWHPIRPDQRHHAGACGRQHCVAHANRLQQPRGDTVLRYGG
jgi:2-methylcitrate dehydratase PrpD